MTSTSTSAPAQTTDARATLLSEVPVEAILAEIARRRAMPPEERLAAGHFTDADERLAYQRGHLAGFREHRANAPRWLGSASHELPYLLEDWFAEHVAYPLGRLWRRLTDRAEANR